MLIYNPANLPTYSLVNTQQPERKLTNWTLKWQQKHLIVKARKPHSLQASLEFTDKQRLQECLQKSSVKVVQIDPAVGSANLQMWATACDRAQKPIFVRAGKDQKLPYLQSIEWRLKRTCDFLAAALLLAILSPVILGLVIWRWLKSPQSPVLVRYWRVGHKGQVFGLFKFNALASVGYHGYWQNLPQLFNVLRGEMSLVGPRPWTLTEVNYLQPKQLANLPGITGILETKAPLAVSTVRDIHLAYIYQWSLAKDSKILLQTLLRIFSGDIN
ncbi:MAG: sugar transferase [Chroococcus sp. CMT-3BRIN-NPC107]|jgi:lipopolysaccharide/colanic/teichoic acid biosynthesis glycosyltransferase|nr:sugar transferase [Chroococcus sp. CMT-3BRIN-NPC107]